MRVYRHATWSEREAMHDAIAARKADAIATRMELGRRYLEVHYCGPLHAFPADRTREVLDAVGYSGITFLPDERIEALVGWDSVVKPTSLLFPVDGDAKHRGFCCTSTQPATGSGTR